MKKMDNNISCSELIKKTARSLVFLKLKARDNNYKKKATDGQVKGIEHQEKISSSEYKEMRGIYHIEDKRVYYSFDEVIVSDDCYEFVEHKNIENMFELEEWYIQYSILQLALYSILVEETNYLCTASFYVKNGNEKKELIIDNRKKKFTLIFGNDNEKKIFNISVKNPYPILELYKNKIGSVSVDNIDTNVAYNNATIFDSKYKRKEWKILSEHIRVEDQKNVFN